MRQNTVGENCSGVLILGGVRRNAEKCRKLSSRTRGKKNYGHLSSGQVAVSGNGFELPQVSCAERKFSCALFTCKSSYDRTLIEGFRLLLPHDSGVEARYTVAPIRAPAGNVHLPDDLRLSVWVTSLIWLPVTDVKGALLSNSTCRSWPLLKTTAFPPRRIEPRQVLPPHNVHRFARLSWNNERRR